MANRNTQEQLRRELDQILLRLERHKRATLSEARSEGARLVGDIFAAAQVVASRNLDALGYERLSRRARELSNALERVRDGSRRVTGITEILRMEGDVITLQDIFTFHQDEVTADGAVVGRLAATGLRPSFLDKFERNGVSLPTGMFTSNGHHDTPFLGGVHR